MKLDQFIDEVFEKGYKYKIVVLNTNTYISDDYLFNYCLFNDLVKTEVKDDVHIAYLNVEVKI